MEKHENALRAFRAKICFGTQAMSVMAEVPGFTTENLLQVQEVAQNCCDTGCEGAETCRSSTMIGESDSVIRQEVEGKIDLGSARVTQENLKDGGAAVSLDQSTVTPILQQSTSGHSLVIPSNTVPGNVINVLNNSSYTKVDSCKQQNLQLPNKENQFEDTNAVTNPLIDSNKCAPINLPLNDHLSKQVTAQLSVANTLPCTAQVKQQGSGSSLPVTYLTSIPNNAIISPYFASPGNQMKMQLPGPLPHNLSTAAVSLAQSTVCGVPLITRLPTTSSVTSASNPLTSFIILPPQNRELLPTMPLSGAKFITPTNLCYPTTTSVVGPNLTVVAVPKIPVPFPNILIQKADPLSSLTSGNPQGVVQAPVSLSTPVTRKTSAVPATSNIASSSVTPAATPNLLHKDGEPQLNVVSRAVSTVSSTLPLPVTTCAPGSNMTVAVNPKIPAPIPNLLIQKDDPLSSLSSGYPQGLVQAPVSLTTPVTLKTSAVPATSDIASSSVTPAATPSLSHKDGEPQLNVVSSAVSTLSSTLPLPVTTSSAVCTEIPKAANSMPVERTASTANMETSKPLAKDAVLLTTADSSSFVPEIQTVFSDFMSCSKCNSLLVCSCPGPSSGGQSSDAVLTTCSASCQGVCTCVGKTVDHANEPDGKPDVKPAIFPVVPLNRLDQLFDSLVEYDKVAKAEQPETITTRLFPYQLQALNWMMTRENNTDLAPFWSQVNKKTWINKGTNISTDRKPNSPKGGILADDMGLGKTLTVITLIMANHINGQPMFSRRSSSHKRPASTSGQGMECKAEPAEKMPRTDSNDDGTDNGDVIMDDKDSVKKVTIKKRKVDVDKKKRLADSKTLKQPGFKFRQMYLSKFSSKSVKKEKCKEKKEVTKSKTPPPSITLDDDNLDMLVGPWLSADNDSKGTKSNNNSKSLDDEHGATLIVCPLSVLSNWTDQICSHVHPDVSLQVYMYYGAERLRDVKFLRQQDIVLTTYPTLTNDYSRNDSPLHKIMWLRVILDEGHTIRNPQTRLTKAMAELAAKRRWVLTGTPIQNRLDDLWSVVKFLRLEPFDDKHWWNTALASSVRRGCQQAVNRLQKLLKHISIRRLKFDQDEGKPLVKLPPRTVVIQEIELSGEERELYDAMQNHGQLIIGRYLRDGTVLKKYAHCFAILMRLRQLCLHPSLCAKESESLQHAQNLLQGLDDSDDDDLDADHDTQRLINDLLVTLSSGVDEECSVCLDSLVEPVITRCAHVFCQQCIMDVIASENVAPNCPLCRAPVNENELIKVPEKKKSTEAKKPGEEPAESKKSSKLEALINALVAIRDKDPSRKSLVVSQFTSFLDIVEDALKKQDFLFVRLDGRMAQEARARAIETFSDRSSSSPTVFLLSLTAGGVGLNLTAATRVFLLDPAWNPAVEEQCFDRSHRLGQTEEVIITKYIVTNSVEERMVTLQEKKRELMGQAFGLETQSQEDRRRARVRDIKHLIGL